jgi:hypothetical protein
MIELFASFDRLGIGIELILSSERIPYSRIRSSFQSQASMLLIATSVIPDDVADRAMTMPALVIGDLPVQFQSLFNEVSRETVLRNGQCVWCPLPVGATFTSLLNEEHGPQPVQGLTPRIVHEIYYRLPGWARSLIQRSVYRKLRAKLASHPEPSTYPVDPSGMILAELLKALIRDTAGGLVRLDRWPAPYKAAAALTHDIEPSRFSYTRGLPALLQASADAGFAPSLGLVAKPAREYLGAHFPLSDLNVYCHGMEHRGETVAGTRDQIASVLRDAKFELEHLVRHEIRGFRSPRLDRSPDLFRALSDSGFTFSSSAPDVDRESMARYGGGIRWNFPFRPPLAEDNGQFTLSQCLELPVSAPDCIQPLFGGESVDDLRTAVRQKIDFIEQTGALYTGIVHAGVFDQADSNCRLDHLRFVTSELDRPGFWVASMDEIASWWLRRESVHLVSNGSTWSACNGGDQSINGLCFVAEDSQGNVLYRAELPGLDAGASTQIEFLNQPLGVI